MDTTACVKQTFNELIPLFESTLTFSVALSVVESIVERDRSAPVILAVATAGAVLCAVWIRIKLAAIALPSGQRARANLADAVSAEGQCRGTPEHAAAQKVLARAELSAILVPILEMAAWASTKLVRVLVQFESVLISSALSQVIGGGNPTAFIIVFALFGLCLAYGVTAASQKL